MLDKWARTLLRYTIPHTFVGFPWWVLTISTLSRTRLSVTCTSCRPPLATNLGLLQLAPCLSGSSCSCHPPYVTELTDLGGCPWPYTRLACIRPLTGSTAVQLAWLTLSGDSCQAAFHRVAPAYGPKRPYFKLVNANETDEFQLCPTSFASKIPHSRPSSIELPDLLT